MDIYIIHGEREQMETEQMPVLARVRTIRKPGTAAENAETTCFLHTRLWWDKVGSRAISKLKCGS